MPSSTIEHLEPQDFADRLLRKAEVLRLLSIGHANWDAGVRSGRYPKAVRVGRSVRWRLSDIRRVIENGAPLTDSKSGAAA
jgi:prophage regulatory protein